MDKSTISTGPFSIAFCMFTRGYVFFAIHVFPLIHQSVKSHHWKTRNGPFSQEVRGCQPRATRPAGAGEGAQSNGGGEARLGVTRENLKKNNHHFP